MGWLAVVYGAIAGIAFGLVALRFSGRVPWPRSLVSFIAGLAVVIVLSALQIHISLEFLVAFLIALWFAEPLLRRVAARGS